MAAVVYLDRLDGERATHMLIQGWAITRGATVAKLIGAQNIGQLLSMAEAALVAEVGERGDPCPDISVPTYLEQFGYEVIDNETVKATIIYKGFPALQIEFSASMSQVESNIDRFGNIILVTYKYPNDYLLDPRKAGKVIKQGGMISKPQPELIFSIKFTCTSGINSVTALCAIEGFVNANVWRIGTIPGNPRTWMAERIRAVSKDGFSYDMDCAFHYRSQGWDPLVTYINPDDGKPPPNLVQSNPTTWLDPAGNISAYTPQGPQQTTFPNITSGPN